MVDRLPPDPVAGADLERRHPVQHVELGERDAPNAADLHRLAHQHGVEPAAAATAPGHRAELAPALAQALARRVLEFRRERPAAHPRRVRLGDAEHIAHGPGADARAGGRVTGHGVGRGDERIGAVVDVQHRSLRTFVEDPPALPSRAVEPAPHGRRVGEKAGGNGQQVALQRARGRVSDPEAAAQGVVVEQELAQTGPERFRVAQVAEADGTAPRLVLVSRADAAPGGADPPGAAGPLARLVELPMDGQDKAGVLRNGQVLRADGDALRRHRVDLVGQRPRVHHRAVADHRKLAAHHAGRQQAQAVFDSVHHQRMAGIVPALEADHDIGPAGKPVDDLALSLVAPLGAHHRDVTHRRPRR